MGDLEEKLKKELKDQVAKLREQNELPKNLTSEHVETIIKFASEKITKHASEHVAEKYQQHNLARAKAKQEADGKKYDDLMKQAKTQKKAAGQAVTDQEQATGLEKVEREIRDAQNAQTDRQKMRKEGRVLIPETIPERRVFLPPNPEDQVLLSQKPEVHKKNKKPK